MKKLLIFIVILFILLSILYYKNIEKFDTSPSSDISEGASEYYNWGYKPINSSTEHQKKKCPKCDDIYLDNHICNIVIDEREKCRHCDITQNKDIDKYVLKSSVPPCPDMSLFATKSMLSPSVNMDNYILKTELPSICRSYYPDSDKYILKTDCPPTIVQENTKCPDYSQYDIKKHPLYKSEIKEKCIQYKKSWTHDFEQWWEDLFSNLGNKISKKFNNQQFPTGYSYSPYSGYGIDNPGYLLDGSNLN